MQIAEFEKQIIKLLSYIDEDGIQLVDDSLLIYPHQDECLGAKFRGIPIPCEGQTWEKALDTIVEFIRSMQALDALGETGETNENTRN